MNLFLHVKCIPLKHNGKDHGADDLFAANWKKRAQPKPIGKYNYY